MKTFLLKIFMFYNFKNYCILHGRIFVMHLYEPPHEKKTKKKKTICKCENKGADQLRSYCEADQRLCFRYSDSTIHPLHTPKFQASSLLL